MALFRRREPLHSRLAREGGLLRPPAEPHDTTPRWGGPGIHGIARPREWDAVATAAAPALVADVLEFTALPDGTLLVDDELEDGALAPLADALERTIKPPYRAQAVRQGERWAVGAQRIRVVELPSNVHGESLELVAHEGRRTLAIDDDREFGTIPALELAAGDLDSYVIRATRLDGDLWEMVVSPL